MLNPALSPEHALLLAFPPTGRLPSTLSAADCWSALFEVSSVLRSRPTPRLFPDSFVSSTSCRGPLSLARPRAKRGLPGSDAILSNVMWPQTPAGRQRLALRRRTYCLRWWRSPRPLQCKYFEAQSHTPLNHCVRFAMVVTFHSATLVTGRALPLTRAGLSPAGSRQLRLAHHDSPHFQLAHYFWLAGCDSPRLPLLFMGLPRHYTGRLCEMCHRVRTGG